MLFWHLRALKHMGLSLWQQRRARAQLAPQRLVPPALGRRLRPASGTSAHSVPVGATRSRQACASHPVAAFCQPCPYCHPLYCGSRITKALGIMHVWQVLARETQKVCTGQGI